MAKSNPILFEENSDDGDNENNSHEHNFNVNQTNEYAKNYNVWRKKEVINKLKTKYGELVEFDSNNSSSSSEDDEEAQELTQENEKDFFKTLSFLKNKDPSIYDENVQFFEETSVSSIKKKRKKKDQPTYLKDYERNLILEKGGVLSDDNDDDPRSKSPTYTEEQIKLKSNLKRALKSDDDSADEEDWGGIFKARQKTVEEKQREDAEYKLWLAGQTKQINDREVESQLKPLKDYWTNPKLDEGEKFLRDYILNKRFLEKDNDNYIPTYEEIVHDSDEDLSEDESHIDKQEEFEHKYNFRFEEPDQDFIKQYPRTVESSLRKKDDKRSVKRAETKQRKTKEKQQKMEDLKKLRELKRQELEEKIEKLKEITGNTDVAFNDLDVEGDFDPEAHDKRMQELFDDTFYEGQEGDQKPEFPELDQELEIENWERWQPEERTTNEQPHCEDDAFNMDCEYDPQATSSTSEQSKNKKRRRKSRFAQALSEPKPKFDPETSGKTYEQYLDEYYKLDCEDIIGDIPCRFKYRKVVPNSFGLTIDEILMANDRELNRWCSLKKAVQIRPDHVEKYDQIAFERKAQNIELKRKILPSLFKNQDAPPPPPSTTNNSENLIIETDVIEDNPEENDTTESATIDGKKATISKQNNKKKRKKNKTTKKAITSTIKTAVILESEQNKETSVPATTIKNNKKKRKLSAVTNEASEVGGATVNKKNKRIKLDKKKEKKQKLKKLGLSEGRLTAYGINPKKFKNKIMYAPK